MHDLLEDRIKGILRIKMNILKNEIIKFRIFSWTRRRIFRKQEIRKLCQMRSCKSVLQRVKRILTTYQETMRFFQKGKVSCATWIKENRAGVENGQLFGHVLR